MYNPSVLAPSEQCARYSASGNRTRVSTTAPLNGVVDAKSRGSRRTSLTYHVRTNAEATPTTIITLNICVLVVKGPAHGDLAGRTPGDRPAGSKLRVRCSAQ